MTVKRDYDSEAIKLAKAIDIAIESIKRYPPEDLTEAHINHIIKTYLDWKHSVLNPALKFKNIASLKYHVQTVLLIFRKEMEKRLSFFGNKSTERI